MLNEFTKKEAPIQGLAGLGGGVPSRLLTLASGTPTYIDEVFSTFLYDGTGSTQTITHGIDITGEGGMTWIKRRSGTSDHNLFDTERGYSSTESKILFPNTTSAGLSISSYVNATTNGFVLNHSGNDTNDSSSNYVSWNFRKCPGFFDVVTYTGNGTGGLNISHDLGSVPGFIMVKSTSLTEGWFCYHRSLGNTKMIALNGSGAAGTATQYWNDTTPTDSVFTVGTDSAVNSNGATYVAYLFAHNDGSFGEDSDEAVIKCGSYTGNGSATGVLQDLGFEPQWVLIKRTDSAENWQLVDNMRGVLTGGNDRHLEPNVNAQEQDTEMIQFESTGFRPMSSDAKTNGSSANYIYIAIRRPHKPPEAATDVFAIDTKSAKSANTPSYTTNFPVDFALRRNNITSINSTHVFTRLTAGERLLTDSSNQATTDASFDDHFMFNNGYGDFASGDSNDYGYFFKRAPGFMDVVTYTGTGSNQNINHNLGTAPQFMIVKTRSGRSDSPIVYHSSRGATEYGKLDSTNSFYTGAAASTTWNQTEPTSSVFSVGTDGGVNQSTVTYLALLFSSLDGICKVGSYTGTASAINVDCGFTNGARFVIIKRTDDSTGANWYVFDTSQGINSGNDPYFRLNVTNAQGTADLIDPLDAGFSVASGTTNVNYSGGTYIFLAIA